jgi:ATP-dependent Clp protease protease subunit
MNNSKSLLVSLLIFGFVESYATNIENKELNTSNIAQLSAKKLKNEHKELLKDLEKLKWKNKVLSAQFELKELKEKNKNYELELRYKEKLTKLRNDATLAEVEASKISNEMNVKKAAWELKTEKLEAEISIFKMEKERKQYADKEPSYLDNPLTKENTLVISDRRVDLNGAITSKLAEKITRKINYFNNKENDKPIFIVIDKSPGGSVMAGYQIIKAIESSQAPVYVVLKSFAASMAAVIVTFSERSYAYSHATILHHQPSTYLYGSSNLTEQKENYSILEKWWKYLGTPVAEKMGISIEDFQKQMYEHSSRGDWSEFAVDAQKLNWIKQIVTRIEDTSILQNFSEEEEEKKEKEEKKAEKETLDKNGHAVVYLPHLSPTDAYFLYSPDNYYRVR